jgi:rRNA-processing protein FCF1
MELEPGAAAVLDAIQREVDRKQFEWLMWDRLLDVLVQVPVSKAVLPRCLHDEAIWPYSNRNMLIAHFHGGPESYTFQSKSGMIFGNFLGEIRSLAEQECARSITEWHIAKVMVERGKDMLKAVSVQDDLLLERIAAHYGRTPMREADKKKAWCVVDTNFFQEYTFFDEVDWHKELKELNVDAVVLVVPMAVLRELDLHKSDIRRERLRDRARKVLRRLEEIMFKAVPGEPGQVRAGVEVLPYLRLPTSAESAVADDQIVATAAEFAWTHPGANVWLVTGDATPRIIAQNRALQVLSIPDHLERLT